MTTRIVAFAAALLAAALCAAPPPARAAADPFYVDLLREGVLSYDRGNFAAAAKQLRLACFGMLDDPRELAACLTRLAVAEGAAGDTEGFRQAFRRIVEVEVRFGAFGKADLPPEIRAAFEQRALNAIPAATLEALPGFKDLLSRKLEAQIAALPARERRRQLEERLAKDSKSVTWNLMLADLDLAEGKTAAAISRAEQVVPLAPHDPRASCLRGLARASGNRCKEALADLETCYLCGREVRYAAALLGCRVELAQWQAAAEQVRALPPELKADRKLAALAQQVTKHQGAAGPAGQAAPAAPAVAGGGASTGPGKTGRGAAPNTGKPAAGSAAASGSPTPSGSASPGPGAASGTGGRTGPIAGGNSQQGPPPPPPPVTPAPPSSGTAAPSSTGAASPPSHGPAARPLSAAERDAMARCERLLAASSSKDLKEALRLARELADAHPDSKEAQYLAGEASYRNSRWTEAVAFFKRGGTPGDDRPELLFYLAISLYETGDQPGAAAALKRSLPNLQQTPYIQSFVKRILGQ